MSIALITGSFGLIGSETAKFVHEKDMDVVGIDNNLRKYFFGEDGSTNGTRSSSKRIIRKVGSAQSARASARTDRHAPVGFVTVLLRKSIEP